MPDTVLVTVRYEGREQDYSLPLQASIEQWLPVLGRALGAGEGAAVFFREKELELTRSLADCCVWDGSVLTLVRR